MVDVLILLALVIHSAPLWWTQDKGACGRDLMGGFVLSSPILHPSKTTSFHECQGRQ